MLTVPVQKRNPENLAVRIGGNNLLLLNAAELEALRAQLTLWLAMNRPGSQANNAGVTPRWFMDRVTALAIVRDRLASMKASEPETAKTANQTGASFGRGFRG